MKSKFSLTASERAALYRERHPEEAKASRKAYIQKIVLLCQKAKSVPCADCGRSYGYWVMEFDHRPGEIKLFNISRATRVHSFAKVLAEIAKCDVVCSNCHAERTYRREMERKQTTNEQLQSSVSGG